MSSEVLCVSLGDDEDRVSALKEMIEEHDSPELLYVLPFGRDQENGMWVRSNLVNKNEIDRCRATGRIYRDDRSTFEWIWSPEEKVTLPTPGPWEQSRHERGKLVCNPNQWEIKKHEFPNAPYEGDFENEYGIYPPSGERGPVALVAGEVNARLIAAAPDLLAACKAMLELPGWHGHEAGRAAIAKAEGRILV